MRPRHRTLLITLLTPPNRKLKDRLSRRDITIEELTAFRTPAISRPAPQQDELQRLRQTAATRLDPCVRSGPPHRIGNGMAEIEGDHTSRHHKRYDQPAGDP
jgi:hypothetical protein